MKNIRLSLGLSQQEFGKQLGVSRDIIVNLEVGRVKQPKENLINHLCEIFNVNKDWLYTGQGTMFCNPDHPQRRLQEAISILKNLEPPFQDYALKQIEEILDLQKRKYRGD